ncbi:MAG: hypothetical protein ACRDTZ_14050 [Pseudonocardiaceae bacterium]
MTTVLSQLPIDTTGPSWDAARCVERRLNAAVESNRELTEGRGGAFDKSAYIDTDVLLGQWYLALGPCCDQLRRYRAGERGWDPYVYELSGDDQARVFEDVRASIDVLQWPSPLAVYGSDDQRWASGQRRVHCLLLPQLDLHRHGLVHRSFLGDVVDRARKPMAAWSQALTPVPDQWLHVNLGSSANADGDRNAVVAAVRDAVSRMRPRVQGLGSRDRCNTLVYKGL